MRLYSRRSVAIIGHFVAERDTVSATYCPYIVACIHVKHTPFIYAHKCRLYTELEVYVGVTTTFL